MSDAPTKPTILIVVSNPAISNQTGWPIGYWWAELTHPYWEFTQSGLDVVIASPEGGAVTADSFSDPEDASGYSAADLISLGFKHSPAHMALLSDTPALSSLDLESFDAVFFVGGQGPMYTFVDNDDVHRVLRSFYEAGKPTAVVCHATATLLKATDSNGELIIRGKKWTGFADAEEKFADDFVGQKIQPFWIEEEARKISGTTFTVAPEPFAPFAIQDGNLITGQQQHSGILAAHLVMSALAVGKE